LSLEPRPYPNSEDQLRRNTHRETNIKRVVSRPAVTE
jgi:hypothetical protein